MKRFLVILLVIAMAASVASAMGAKPSEEVTLRFYFGGNKPKDEDMVWENVAKLAKDALNVKFDVQHIPWSEYGDKIKLLAASGDNYDMHFDAYWMTFPFLVMNKALLPLDDLFPKYAPKLYEQVKASGDLKAAMVKGQILAVPWNYPKVYHAVACIREDIRKKYNLSDKIETIEDYEAFIEAAWKKEPTMVPTAGVFKEAAREGDDPPIYAMLVKYELDLPFTTQYYFTYSLNDPKVTLMPLERTPAYREACQIRRRWYEKGIIPKNAINESEEGKRFQQGNTLALIATFEGAYADWPVESRAFLLYPNKKVAVEGALGNAVAINLKAANPERTLMFLEWHNAAQANYDSVMYGIEGKTYTLKDIGAKKKVADFMPGQDMNTSFLSWNGRWGLYRINWMRGGPGDNGTRYIAEGIPFMTSLKTNTITPIAGFTFDPEPVKTELARRMAVYDEYARPLKYGMVADIDKGINELIQKCSEAGTDAILAEMQKQVNDFLAGK